MTSGASQSTPSRAATCPPDKTFTRLLEGTLSDAELQALQAHGDGCPACGRTLSELARTMTPGHGDWLGERYQLLEPLGIGGMGVVYTAFDTKLQRKVAVKRLRELAAAASAERRRARFLREAQLLASLSHPNVLTVHDVGGVDPELYVVMELVDGWPMSRWISEAVPRPGWRQILDLYVQVGRGLSAAHQLGVVHRDVKPENILVARNGRVLIGDFGLAGLAEAGETSGESAAAPAELTQTGAVLGTPAYMAPEQHDGKPADMLSDQFSFCVSLYESLHGRRPFPGQTAREIAAAVRGGAVAIGGDGVPRAVDRAVARGLAADPARRYGTMDALLAALASARDQRPVKPVLVAGAIGVVLAASSTAAIMARRHAVPSTVAFEPPPIVVRTVALGVPPEVPPASGGNLAPGSRVKRDSKKAAEAKAHALAWARNHPGMDPRLLLDFADGSYTDRDGLTCLKTLNQMPVDVWPPALAERALRRRASCEMLRGRCVTGRRMLEPLESPSGGRAAALANCPVASLPTLEDRIQAIGAQADDARYAGNKKSRRDELKQSLQHQTAAPEIQACFRHRSASRSCGRLLAALTRAYQVLAESFLVARDCADGAALDVMRSQVKFQSFGPDGGDPALRCRAERVFPMYKSCADAGEAAERRCLARAQAAKRDGTAVLPDVGR
ncbi:MAG TPA: serine/threonine-protein kinase [Polyangia bacterium]|nr:serine/threonine-protein kinase [Polyangia bacterium]